MRYARAAAAVAFVLGLFATGRDPSVRAFITGLAAHVHPLAFIAIYALGAVLLFPASVLTLAAGAGFGLWKGALYSWLGATAGAAAAFLVGRHLARERVRARLGADPRAAALERAIAEGGWRIVVLTRLSPILPYVAQNYVYGLLPIGFWPYLAASALGMIPGTFLFVYLGSAAGGGAAAGRWSWALGLAATAGVAVYGGRLAQRALGQATGARP